MAVEQARSVEAVLLHKVTELAAESASTRQTLQDVTDLICEMAEWPIGHVYRPDPEQPELLKPTEIWHLQEGADFQAFEKATRDTEFKSGEGLPGRVLESGEPGI